MTFQDAQYRLLAYVRDRIHNGELTERALARRIGISQPHAHNVLKGARNLSPQVFDALLKYLHMSLLDLGEVTELQANINKRIIFPRQLDAPLLGSPLGPKLAWPSRTRMDQRFPLPYELPVAPPSVVFSRLARDPDMPDTLAGYDIAALDTGKDRRENLLPDGLYVISHRNEAVLRYLRPGAHGLYILHDLNRDAPEKWERLRIEPSQRLDLIRARVCWLGREGDRDLAPPHGRFLVDAISW